MRNDHQYSAQNPGLSQVISLTLDAMNDLGGKELKDLARQLSLELADPNSNLSRFLGELYEQTLLDAELAYAAEDVNDQDHVYVICPTRKKQKESNLKRFNDAMTLTMIHFDLVEESELAGSINSAIHGNPGIVTFFYHFYDYVMFMKHFTLIQGNV